MRGERLKNELLYAPSGALPCSRRVQQQSDIKALRKLVHAFRDCCSLGDEKKAARYSVESGTGAHPLTVCSFVFFYPLPSFIIYYFYLIM